MWSGSRALLAVAAASLCCVLSLAGAAEVAEAGNSPAAPGPAPPPGSSSQPEQELQDEQENDWDYLRRFYDLSPPVKRAYSYVSEFKRLPVYNFGLGKRSDPAGNRLYSFGLGKRQKSSKQYSFGLGKRPNGLYSFGLGKRSMDYPEENEETIEQEEEEEPESEDNIDTDLEDMDMEKRTRAYSFGLGKRFPQGPYSFGLGKRAQLYNFGLGKRASGSRQYSFGLGKRLNNHRQYAFGLGKREVSASEAAAVAAESAASHVIKRRSASPEQLEWADAETRRAEEQQRPAGAGPAEFGRAGRRPYSFGLGKRLPLYSFGVGKRLSA